jgi:hypothetical protein
MIVGVMRKLCVWVDCKNPEALAAYASMAAVGRSLRLYWGQRMCVSCTAYACAVFWVAKLCAVGAYTETQTCLTSSVGPRRLPVGRISGLSNR